GGRYRTLPGGAALPAMRGRGGVPITGKKAAACGWLYVAGRQVADLDAWTLSGDTFTFQVLPATVDAFWSRYGGLSHLVLWYRAKYWIYRVQAGHLADGRCTILWPSWLRMPTHPGGRLPKL